MPKFKTRRRAATRRVHRMPFGTAMQPAGGVEFRLWAPDAKSVELCLERGGSDPAMLPMHAGTDGWYHLADVAAVHGDLYRFRIDATHFVTDPASRFQPHDVHGRSCLIDPQRFPWQDGHWLGRPWEEAVLYELHIGTFTAMGTYTAATARLDHLARLGITAVELMPVGDFPGRCNWGYDGVLPFAPDSCYGEPDALKAFVQAAHEAGIMVIVDVVYNHFGPDGNYLHLYAGDFFTGRHDTPWGDAINYSGENCENVRRFFIHNAMYWLEEFNVDGLRLDAVHAIFDDSKPDILVQLAQTVRTHTKCGRHVHLLLENDNNSAHYLKRHADGDPSLYTAQWNDDWHHAMHVLLTGETYAYYQDYANHPQMHLARCLAEGFAYQGEASPFRSGRRRGCLSVDLPCTAFITFLQNHDQIGNRAHGERLIRLTSRPALRAAATIHILSPAIPALFMGEEFGCTQPFLFFADFDGELRTAVSEGRRREFELAAEPTGMPDSAVPDPHDARTFTRSVIDWSVTNELPHCEWLTFYQSLLSLRHRVIVPRLPGTRAERVEPLPDDHPLIAHWRMGDGMRLTLVANLGDLPQQLEYELPLDGTATLFSQPEQIDGPHIGRVLPPWFAGWYLGEDT